MAADTAIQRTDPQTVEVTNPRGRSSWTYRPNVDIFDTADEVLLLADVPGADPEKIDVSMEAGILTIQAEVPGRAHDAAQSTVHEYGIGNFHRRFEIDAPIEVEQVAAEYRHGVLTVHLPKSQQARRRRIPVTG